MSRTLIAPAGFVLGDGTTAASVTRDRWRRMRWILAFVLIAAATVTLALLGQVRTDSRPLSIENPGPDGAQALASILRDRGVTVIQTYQLERSAALLGPHDTLVIAGVWYPLDSGQAWSIEQYTGNVVWLEPDFAHIAPFTDQIDFTSGGSDEARPAECQAPAALKAERIVSNELRAYEYAWHGPGSGEICFNRGRPDTGSYAWLDEGERQVHFFADGGVLSNAHLAEEGNAALAINAIGSTDRVIWYVGNALDDTILATGSDRRASDYIEQQAPAWVNNVGLMLVLAAATAALWRGRRLGKLVTERLPVVVRSAETTLGRAKLYRDAKARGHAAAALRAGLIGRVARRIGIPGTADAQTVIAAIAAASHLRTDQVDALLYGPPPGTDEQMIHLVHELDALERKVEQL